MTSPSNPPFQPLTLSVEEIERALAFCRVQWAGQASLDLNEAREKLSEYNVGCALRIVFEAAQAAADLRQRLEEVQLHYRVTRRTVESLAPALVEARERASQAEAALGEMRTMLDGFQEWLRHTSFSPHPARVAFAEALTELQRRRSAPGQEN